MLSLDEKDTANLVSNLRTELAKNNVGLLGPANTVICHPKYQKIVELLDSRFKIFTDLKYPTDKIVLFRNGPSRLDSPMVFAPYVFNFYEKCSNQLMVAYRYGKKFVLPGSVTCIKIAKVDAAL